MLLVISGSQTLLAFPPTVCNDLEAKSPYFKNASSGTVAKKVIKANTVFPQSDFFPILQVVTVYLTLPLDKSVMTAPLKTEELNMYKAAMNAMHEKGRVKHRTAGHKELENKPPRLAVTDARLQEIHRKFVRVGLLKLSRVADLIFASYDRPGHAANKLKIQRVLGSDAFESFGYLENFFRNSKLRPIANDLLQLGTILDSLIKSEKVADYSREYKGTLQQAVDTGQFQAVRRQLSDSVREIQSNLSELLEGKIVEGLPHLSAIAEDISRTILSLTQHSIPLR